MLELSKPLVLTSDPLADGWEASVYAGLEGVAEYIDNSGLFELITQWEGLNV